jgi:CHAT domain-containing protein/tetratricopeptide (TPR) repeat protein
MVCHRLRRLVRNRLLLTGVLLLCWGWLASPAPRGADPPKPQPLTDKQKARLKERDRLFAAVRKLAQAGKLAEAIAAMEKVVAIEREVFGNVHERVATAMKSLANLEESRGKFGAARKARQEVLAVLTQLYGKKDWRVIDARWDLDNLTLRARLSPADEKTLEQAAKLGQQVKRLDRQGKFKEALPLAQKVVELLKKLLTEKHPAYATSLNNLALLYLDMGEYRKALPLLEQARDLTKKLLTANHPDYARSLNNLAGLYRAMGEYQKALPLFEQARNLYKKLLTENHPAYANSLNNLATLYKEMGKYRQALPLLEQARDQTKKLLTANHPAYATSLNNLAGLYQDMGEYQKALPLFEQARDQRKKLLTENHPAYATSLHNLAGLYQARGEYRKALPLLEQACDLRKKLLTENHPDYAQSLNNLAGLYEAMGEYKKVLPLLEQARDLYKKLHTARHPDYAHSLHNLAGVYHAMGEYKKALPLYEQARDLYKKLLTANHPAYARCLGKLAGLYQDMGEYRQALPLFEQARDLIKQLLTENHPAYATSLNNLALLYLELGEYQKARPLLEQARDLYKKVLTESHPDYALSLHNLAALYHCLKKPKEAAPLFQQALSIKKRFLEDTFAAQNERQRRAFLTRHKDSLFAFLSVSPQADLPTGDIYRHVLAWKGALATRQAEEQAARDQPKLRPLVEELRQVRAGLGKLAREVPATASQRADWRERFDDLEKDKERLEVRLARESDLYRRFQQLRDATAKQVADALPAKTAFIDFLFYRHSSPPPEGKGALLTETKLLAFVLIRGQKPSLVRFQATEKITQELHNWRQAVVNRQPPDKPARELSRRLWQPLRKHLKGVEAVLIAPDGPLCGLPFAALPGRKADTYLVEELAFGYVTSGRHLLELNADKDSPRGQGLLTLGGLAYGKPAAKPAAAAAFAPLAFADLPGARVEAERIGRLYRQAFPRAGQPRRLSGPDADAARLKRELPPAARAAPRYLHLATHAFFEAPRPEVKGKKPPSAWDLDRRERTYVRNPLLLSGLVLSGANESYDKGILTAEEVSLLDLRGVDLAVLSACQTGLGKVEGGEGLLGLQRGFQMAGARTLAVSLWSVNDAATSVLMEEFYTNLWVKKVSKLQALRQAQLTVLRNPGRVLKRGRELAELLAGESGSKQERARLARRGIYKEARELPEGGKVRGLKRSPVAWWAAFVLCGDGK